MTEEMALVYVDGGPDRAMRIVAWDLLRSKVVVKANYLDSCELYLKDGTREKISTSSRTLALLCKRADVDKVFKHLRNPASGPDGIPSGIYAALKPLHPQFSCAS